MTQFSFAALLGLLALAAPAAAQELKPLAQPAPAAKVYDVPKDGLVISGKLTKDDPPLAGAPVAELNGAPHQVFLVKLQKGQSYVIDLASKDFDAYLIIQNAIGKVLAHDDDSGGGMNSRIVHVAKTHGEFRFVVSALDREPGSFQLKIRIGELSVDEKLATEAEMFTNEARQLYQHGQVAEAIDKARAALEIRRNLYPAAKHADGHADLAASYSNLGFLLKLTGAYEEALTCEEHALAMRRKLYAASQHPDGHADLAASFNNLGALLDTMGRYEQALPYSSQALAMRQKLHPVSTFPDGHPDIARSSNNLASLLESMGAYEKALIHAEQTLAMYKRLYPETSYPDGHRELAIGLNNLGSLLESMGSYEKATSYHEQALTMKRKLYPASKFPNGHPDLATSHNNLGFLLEALGLYDKALAHHEQALAMRLKLYPESRYPDGHSELASSFNNLGRLHEVIGPFAKALQYFEQGLAMTERLYPASKYPDGHPHLARSIGNLGGLWGALGSSAKALQHGERTLAMRRKLYPESKYPDGHPDLASNLNNLGFLLYGLGSYDKALPNFEQSLAMAQKLYPASQFPDGHPDLASSNSNLGAVLRAIGLHDKALHHYERALALYQKLGRRILATAPEAEALAFANAQPFTRDAYLSLTANMPDTATSAYAAVWASKSAVTRVLEQRHAAARLVGSEQAAKLNELKGLRRRIDQLLQDRRLPPAERDALLAKAADDRDTLERILAKAMPTLDRARERDPNALGPMLSKDAVLIDFIRYTRGQYDPAKPGKAGETRTSRYAAFLLTKNVADDVSIRRIELGEARPIDHAVAQWRTAIEARGESKATTELHDRVWAKLAPHLPVGTKTLFMALDGDLARMPWAALPIGGGQVLLERYALATVPHGPFLLEALRQPRPTHGSDAALLIGGLVYNSPTWPDLLGTDKELHALAALAPTQQMTLTKSAATPAALSWALTKARYAHIATHGYFDADTLVAEHRRAKEHTELRAFGDESRRVAAKNPLGFTGLVLAGGEVLSGLSLVDLPLENLKLVTLSACETGLGEYTAGEGVQGLQRAFHIAGCPNVVASLWKVNDAATAALMAKFYHELWVNKKPPIEALREAQLTIYRHPELIPDLAGERGPVRLKEAVAVKSEPRAAATGAARADTKLWAAFALSGVGR